MRVDLEIDDSLWAKAGALSGSLEPEALVHAALKAFIERETAKRLALLGGSQPALQPAPRRRSSIKR